MALRLLLIIVALVLAIGTTTRVITCRLCCDAHDIATYFRRGTVFYCGHDHCKRSASYNFSDNDNKHSLYRSTAPNSVSLLKAACEENVYCDACLIFTLCPGCDTEIA